MESKKDFSPETDKDETLVTPRFDSGEAETAQPVVPLAVVSGEAETYDSPYAGAHGVPPRAARRASLPLALVLVSALAGSVLGGAGLYLFQKSRQQQQSAPAAQTEQTTGASDAAAGQTDAAPAPETTPAPSPEEAGALAAELPREVAEVPVAAEVPDEKEDKKDREDADRERDTPKRADDDEATPRGARVSAPAPEKRGKKGERDDDDNYRARGSRPRRVEDDSPDDEEYYDGGGARRIGSIVYDREARRERRRQRRQPAVDRVRGIFEGQP